MTDSYYDADTYDELDDDALDERYREYLDEIYPDVEVAGVGFTASRILSECDPVAYRGGFVDWLDSETTDGRILTELPDDDDDDDDDDDNAPEFVRTICERCDLEVEGPNENGGYWDRGGNYHCPDGARHVPVPHA